MSPNQTILAAFVAFVVLLTALNYAFGVIMKSVFGVRFIEDRVSWTVSELGMIAFSVAAFYMVWFLVKFAQSVLSNMEEDETQKQDCLLSCLPSSFMGVMIEFGIPFVSVMIMLLMMGKL